MLAYLRNIKRKIIIDLKKITRDGIAPDKIALGVALGTFASFLPPIPYLHTAVALFLAILFKANKISALLAIWLNNPLTLPIYIFFSVKIGKLLRKYLLFKAQLNEIGFRDYAVDYFTGGVILGLIVSVVLYHIVLMLLKLYHRARLVKNYPPKN